MYPITTDYWYAINQILRDRVNISIYIINADASLISQYKVYDFTNKDYSELLTYGIEQKKDIATLERNYLKIGKSYTLDPEAYYISSVLSGASPDSTGLYAIASCGLVIKAQSTATYSSNTITLITDGAVARVRVNQGTFVKTYDANGTMVVLDGLPGSIDDLNITVLYMTAPYRRAHIKQIYFGTCEIYERQEVTTLSYKDTNDAICLDAPERSVTIGINNLSRRYDPDQETANPQYKQWYTQALIYITQGKYTIPLGRLYLYEYTVNDTEASFTFKGAMSVLMDCAYKYGKTGTQTSTNILKHILHPDLGLTPIDTDQPILSGAEQYGISYYVNYATAKNILLPVPVVPEGQAIQLVCNLTGNYIAQGRIPRDILPEQNYDLWVVPLSLCIDEDYIIQEEYNYGSPEWEAGDKIGEITADVYNLQSATETITLLDKMRLNVGYASGVESNDVLEQITVPQSSDGSAYALQLSQFAYSAYYTARNDSYYTPTPVTATVHKTQKTTKTLHKRDGKRMTVSNPLLAEDNNGSVDYYLENMYDELQYNRCCTIQHRGYPHLDAGQKIRVEIYGKSRMCRILENTITYKNGAMRGETKVRVLE